MPKDCRPSWQQSEKDVLDYMNERSATKYDPQVSFKEGGKGVGGKGSVRVDGYTGGPPPASVEVKNYDLKITKDTAGSTKYKSSSVKSSLKKQYNQRARHLPEGTKQQAFIDARGQGLDDIGKENLEQEIRDLGYKYTEVWN